MKTYIGAIDFYFEAENDSDAIMKLKTIAVERSKQNDDCTSALSLHEKPKGICNARSIELNPKQIVYQDYPDGFLD